MIRINLLPKKVSKKKMGLVQNLIATGAVFLVVLLGIGYFWVSMNGKISDLRRQVAVAKAEKEKLKDVHEQKKKYEKNIAILKNKLDIIVKIQEARYLPIRLLDELTKVLDRDTPVWLTKYSYTNDLVQMEGFSLTNAELASFVTRLEATPFYKNVELLFSEKVKAKAEDREIYRFSLNAKTQTKNAPQPAGAKE